MVVVVAYKEIKRWYFLKWVASVTSVRDASGWSDSNYVLVGYIESCNKRIKIYPVKHCTITLNKS